MALRFLTVFFIFCRVILYPFQAACLAEAGEVPPVYGLHRWASRIDPGQGVVLPLRLVGRVVVYLGRFRRILSRRLP